MATLTKQNLINTFKAAREYNAPFVFLRIAVKENTVYFGIPSDSFDDVEGLYLRILNDDLTHVDNADMQITGLTYGVADDMQDLFSVEG